MDKVIIKARKGELTEELFTFGCQALGWFESDLDSGKYDSDWNSCGYGLGGLYAITKLNKSGSITITVE